MDLCEHVDTKEVGGVIWITRGVAVPFYGWDRELRADVPRLRCSACSATATLPGPGVGKGDPEDWKLL